MLLSYTVTAVDFTNRKLCLSVMAESVESVLDILTVKQQKEGRFPPVPQFAIRLKGVADPVFYTDDYDFLRRRSSRINRQLALAAKAAAEEAEVNRLAEAFAALPVYAPVFVELRDGFEELEADTLKRVLYKRYGVWIDETLCSLVVNNARALQFAEGDDVGQRLGTCEHGVGAFSCTACV
jgi:hypothetical protein